MTEKLKREKGIEKKNFFMSNSSNWIIKMNYWRHSNESYDNNRLYYGPVIKNLIFVGYKQR